MENHPPAIATLKEPAKGAGAPNPSRCRPLYHRLHAFWSRFPFPYRPLFRTQQIGPIQSIEMARLLFGQKLMSVRIYRVGDTFVDTGLSCMAGRLQRWAKEHQVHRALVTHHHEDHSGNAAALIAHGLEVWSSEKTRRIIQNDVPIKFYQHLVWGNNPPASTQPLPPQTHLGPYDVDVIEAPGHCEDQVVFFVPQEGWLFSGDAFLHERIQLFRKDEDFHKTKATLQRVLQLDFDTLFCAHRPRIQNGKQSLQTKLEWLLHLEGETQRLHQQGLSIKQIAQQLLRKENLLMKLLTMGDASAHHVIRAILHPAQPRSEIVQALQHADPIARR